MTALAAERRRLLGRGIALAWLSVGWNVVEGLAEHKSSREALRSLKRQLAKVVYRQLVADRDRVPALAV